VLYGTAEAVPHKDSEVLMQILKPLHFLSLNVAAEAATHKDHLRGGF
jgi:hypothetical protein